MTRTRPIRIALALVAVIAAATVVACGSEDSGGGDGGGEKLSLIAYSTPQEAYEEIIPAFQKTAAGKGVTFNQSYAASGEQSRAVEGGLPADVVAFSLAPDVDRLVDAGLVGEDWASTQNDGFVTDSVVVFVVRKGNPENIRTWDDLTKDGVEVITPNPYTSGGAKWNIMAAWGAQLEQGLWHLVQRQRREAQHRRHAVDDGGDQGRYGSQAEEDHGGDEVDPGRHRLHHVENRPKRPLEPLVA